MLAPRLFPSVRPAPRRPVAACRRAGPLAFLLALSCLGAAGGLGAAPAPAAPDGPTPAAGAVAAAAVPPAAGGRPTRLLPTGRRVRRVPARQTPPAVPVGSFPADLLTSPDGRFVVTTDLGLRQALCVTRAADGAGVARVEFGNAAPRPAAHGLYFGLALGTGAAGPVLFAAQGAADAVLALAWDARTGDLAAPGDADGRAGLIKTTPGDFPAGLALDERGYLYVTNNDPGTSLAADSQWRPGSLAIYDVRPVLRDPAGPGAGAAAAREVGRLAFPDPAVPALATFPLAVCVRRDGRRAYVASQRDGTVSVLDTTDPAAPTLLARVPTGPHPVCLRLNRAEDRLFVANAHADSVSILDTADNTVRASVPLRWPDEAADAAAAPATPGAAGTAVPAGLTPTGLALSPDEKSLYVTLADLNAVAVVTLLPSPEAAGAAGAAESPAGAGPAARLAGYLPAGWYPTAVTAAPDGTRLFVTSAKGNRTRLPNPGYRAGALGRSPAYDLNLVEGTLLILPVPGPADLAAQTARVRADAAPRAGADLRPLGRAAGKIEHVIYVVKENRTYDQVFGDLPAGDGDPGLTLFGADVTPNQHALAQRFVLLDNFFVCAEASGDGWPWSTGAFANEYVEKNLPYNYSRRGRQYDFEGQNNGYPAGGFPPADPDGRPLSALFPAGAPAVPDVSEAPGGHLWDAARRAGLSYRNYGFFCTFGLSRDGRTLIPDNYPSSAGLQPPGHDGQGITDADYRRYDLDYPDGDAPAAHHVAYPRARYGRHDAPSRLAEFRHEFNQMLAADPTGATVPALLTIRLPNDHTHGLVPGAFSPRAHLADNDYAVGELVELVSHSPVWEHAAIFVLEDDAQDGPDHVDGHRSPCLVISPYVRAGSLDHHFYNTCSVLRAIEELLGLGPLSAYDQAAAPVAGAVFAGSPANAAPFRALLPAAAVVGEKNPPLSALAPGDPRRRLARQSLRLNFARPDAAPPRLLNALIWRSVRGADAPLPAGSAARWALGPAPGQPGPDELPRTPGPAPAAGPARRP